MKLYENQLLGAFIYALGYECGTVGKNNVAANLFQQTPLDGTFGDLVAGADWCVALEFKRDWSEARSERAKWSEPQVSGFLNDIEMNKVARRAHFLCFGDHAKEGVVISVIRYDQALMHQELKDIQRFDSESLVRFLVHSAGQPPGQVKIGVPPSVLEGYLRKVAKIRQIKGGGGRQAEWLAIASSSEGYKIRCADSLEQLIELARERAHELKNTAFRERDRDADREMERD